MHLLTALISNSNSDNKQQGKIAYTQSMSGCLSTMNVSLITVYLERFCLHRATLREIYGLEGALNFMPDSNCVFFPATIKEYFKGKVF